MGSTPVEAWHYHYQKQDNKKISSMHIGHVNILKTNYLKNRKNIGLRMGLENLSKTRKCTEFLNSIP